MIRRPNLFAAVAATGIMLLMISPLLYGMVMRHVYLPEPPEWIVVFFALAIPGMLVVNAVGPYNARASFTLGSIANWILYFLLFRGLLSHSVPLQWIRSRAERLLPRSPRKDR